MDDFSTANSLLNHQRDELSRAESIRLWGILSQLLVAMLAACSVFTNEGVYLLMLAGLGAVVITIWLVLDIYYRRHRSNGDQARRMLLIVYGLGEEVGDCALMQDEFTAPVNRLQPMSIREYFDTVAAAGPRRIAEMIDESAFYTGSIQRSSGEVMLVGLFIVLVTITVVGLIFSPRIDSSAGVTIARVLIALGVFLLSSDVLGAALGHLRAAATMRAIRLRLSTARARDYSRGDVLQAMTDYNAAVEGAPLPLRGIYDRSQETLNRSWGEYKKTVGIGN